MSITCIIPAYNEEKRIGSVLSTVKQVDAIDRIIVVSDGSKDRTAEIARSCGVDVIELKENIGKGGAIKVAIDNCTSDILLFLDADLIGLKSYHIMDLLKPVVNGEADMTVGVFSGGRLSTDLAQKLVPHLSGQRAMKRYVADRIPDIDMTRYGVEVAITMFAEKEDIKVREVILKDMTHFTKEEKLGLVRGLAARLKMYWDIVRCIMPQRIKQTSGGKR